MFGPSGSGKTHLAQTLAKILDVPFAIADATSLTEAGYVGEDVENILLRLIQSADNDIKRAEHGIIYIDEIDKIARKNPNPSITRDVSGEGVQQGLLKIIEGCIANVPPQGGRKHPHQEFMQIKTDDILFMAWWIYNNDFTQYKSGLMQKDLYEAKRDGPMARNINGTDYLTCTISKEVWSVRKYYFQPEFTQLIDSLSIPCDQMEK